MLLPSTKKVRIVICSILLDLCNLSSFFFAEVSVPNPSLLADDLEVAMVEQTLKAMTNEPVLGAVGQRRKNLSGQLLEKIPTENGSKFVNAVCNTVCSVMKV